MYSVESLKEGLRDPHLVFQEINRLYHRRLNTRSYNQVGVDIFERDWDTLCILDACRYDLFEQMHALPGELEEMESRGSATEEFLRANFHGRELLDTVYVTGNPMLYRHRDTIETRLHEVVNVWKESGWNETYRTVLPETMTDAARRAREEFPHKRLIIHYLQPHYPFLGPTGRENFQLDRLDFDWESIRRGSVEVSAQTVRRAYRENLEQVLPYVDELVEALPGKTVVTADHGQVIGSRSFPVPVREFGHPSGIYTDGLVKIPWLTVLNGTRPSITPEEPSENTQRAEDDTEVRQRLRELGYVGAD